MDVQIAALRFAEKEPTLIYLNDVLKAIKKSKDKQVQEAAQQVIAALKRPLGEFKPTDSSPPIEFDAERVGGLMESFEKQADVKATIATLRMLSGLDFGDGESEDSRKSWIRWWSDERKSIDEAHLGEREFIIYGRVVDEGGRPLNNGAVSVWLSKSIYERGVLQSAYTCADINGRYVLRFGFLKRDPPEFPAGIPVVRAMIAASPRPLQNDIAMRWFFASRYNLKDDAILTDDPYAKEKNKPAIHADQPFELNFVRQSPNTAEASE